MSYKNVARLAFAPSVRQLPHTSLLRISGGAERQSRQLHKKNEARTYMNYWRKNIFKVSKSRSVLTRASGSVSWKPSITMAFWRPEHAIPKDAHFIRTEYRDNSSTNLQTDYLTVNWRTRLVIGRRRRKPAKRMATATLVCRLWRDNWSIKTKKWSGLC